MFREFNVKFEDVEMLGGADNLLEGTEITKVIVRGDNNKMSSLDSMLKNCNELDTVDGELDLNGVGDIDNLLEGTELVKSIDLKNINNENISANNSFPHVDRINIGGELYNKKAMQNVIASKDWTFDNINYSGTVGDNIVEKEVNIVDDNKATIKDTLEQKARGFEIIGQTYENLVVGSGEATLLDELTLESVDGSPNEFTPHIEQPVCVEAIEGETYQNLIEGKGEYNLTNKATFIPLGLQPNKDYTLQLDSVGKNDKPITVNLGGTETTIQPINDTSKHHKVVVRTPNTLTTDKLDLNGEGVVVNDVMLFEGGSNEIKQDVEYVEGIQNIGELTLCKNLFDKFSIELFIGNLNYLTGAELENSEYMRTDYIEILPNKTYTLSGFGDSSMDLRYTLYNDNKSFNKGAVLPSYPTTTSFTFTTDSNSKYLRIAYNCSNMDTLQLEEGIVATDYQEYFEGERYKIDILTTNGVKNLVNTNPNNWVVKDSDSVIIKSSIKVNEGKTYTVFNSMGQWVAVYESDWNGNQYNLIGQDNTGNWSFVATSEYIKVSLWNISYISDKLSQPHNMNVRIFEGYNDYGYNGYEERKLSTQSILLPQPLNKKGDIKDKFYWDDNKGHYCIKQDTISVIADETNVVDSLFKLDGYYTFAIKVDNVNTGNLIGINSYGISLVPYASLSGLNKEYISFGNEPSLGQICAIVRIKNSRASNKTELLEYFKSNKFTLVYKISTPNIIDLPHLNKKYSLDTYMPTTYLECTNSPMQPSRLLLESDTVRYKPSVLETNTDYTVQFECKEKSDKKVKLSLGGAEKEVDVEVGFNHVNITTPSEIDTSLYKDRLFLSGVGNKVADVIVNKGEMNQYPGYFNGVQSVGELQDDGTYRIGIKTNEGFNISIQTNNPLAKGDKLYWNKSNKRYEIDRSGSIEVPTVSGDIIDLPRLYQREDTNFTIETGNIKPSKTSINYLDID